MKKLITVFACILFAASVFAQAPDKMSYQAVIRNSSDDLVSNQKVGVRISILQGTANGTAVYVELHSPTTNTNGLISMEIGDGNAVSGVFKNIDWSKGPYFIKTETDPSGGVSYSVTGTSQLLSVPYALYAETSGSSLPGPQGEQGLPGEPGEPGAAGLDGEDGLSAYQIWLNQGNTGDEDDFLAAIKGEKGPEGILPEGNEAGNTPYWDGNKWVIDDSNLFNIGEGIGIGTNTPDPSAKLDISSNQQGFLMPRMTTEERDAIESPAQGLLVYNVALSRLEVNDGSPDSPVWTAISGLATISSLDCDGATSNGVFTDGAAGSGSLIVSYNGGDGGSYNGLTIPSTGVTGLTATLSAGNFASGNGTLTFQISGTATGVGNASFSIAIGGQSCVLNVQVAAGQVFCDGPTEIVEVPGSAGGRIWMDRNLGAKRAATSASDTEARGDLYQWGRGSDGHQCRNSPTRTEKSSTDQPGHGDFITGSDNWRSTQNNDLWQGVSGINNPCPSGFRLPTRVEFEAEINAWNDKTRNGGFNSPLKLINAFSRLNTTGQFNENTMFYWTSDVSTSANMAVNITVASTSGSTGSSSLRMGNGAAVRCIKHQ